jgi:hypothetical protein
MTGLKVTLDFVGTNISSVEKIPGESSAVPGTVQLLNGFYYRVPNGGRLVLWQGGYFVVPPTAKFGGLYYGHFCGPNWGWGSGNNNRPPIADGGLDAACKAHDQAWENRNYTNGDRALYSAIQGILARWSYEYEYIRGAKEWLSCRFQHNVTTASDVVCNPAAFLRATVQISTPR